MGPASAISVEPPAAREARESYARWGVVLLLGLAHLLSLMDRAFINLVLEPIRTSLRLTDTQMGLLVGPAFMVFYSVVALPLGRLADSWNRKSLIAAGVLFWSACTGACGLAKSYPMLLAARMGVGFGEAALSPAAVSIISDRFRREQIGRAVGIFTACGSLGGGLAYILGGMLLGWLEDGARLPFLDSLEPWRAAFVLLTLPGLVLGLAILLLLREPVRQSKPGTAAEKPSWAATLAYYRAYPKATIALIVGFSAISIGANGAWIPTFMHREYGWELSRVGPAIGAISLSVNFVGVMVGGWLADRMRARGREDANVVIAIGALLLALPCDLLLPNAGDPYLTLALYAPAVFFMMVCFGVSTAAMPLVVPSHMRSQTVALYVLTANLVGQGLGPLIVALLTDKVFGYPEALRYSLTITPAVFIPLAIVCLLIARKPFRERAEALRAAYGGA